MGLIKCVLFTLQDSGSNLSDDVSSIIIAIMQVISYLLSYITYLYFSIYLLSNIKFFLYFNIYILFDNKYLFLFAIYLLSKFVDNLQIVGTSLACLCIDRLGRKFLLISSAIIMTVGHAIVGTYFYLKVKILTFIKTFMFL